MKEVSPFVWAIPAVMLVVASAPLPYSYYTLLRIVVCGTAAYLAWKQYEQDGRIAAWTAVLGVLAALFNPLIPVYLSREIWFFIDLGSAALLGAHYYRVARPGA